MREVEKREEKKRDAEKLKRSVQQPRVTRVKLNSRHLHILHQSFPALGSTCVVKYWLCDEETDFNFDYNVGSLLPENINKF